MPQNTKNFQLLKHAKLSEIEYKTPVYSNVLCSNMFVRIWIFLSNLFEKQVSQPFEYLEQFTSGSE